MTVGEFNKRLTKLEKDIIRKLPDQFIQAKGGFDIAATVSERVIQKSISGDGTKFSPYSTKPMLTSGTTDKGQSVWRGKKDKQWITIKKGGKNIRLFKLEGGYAELRRLEGFSNRSKNFWFTTEMWRMFGFKRAIKGARGFKIIYGGRTKDSQDKINWNSASEGKNILDMTKKEEVDVSNDISIWIDKMAKNNGI